MKKAEQECTTLMNNALIVLQKTTQDDSRDARSNTALIHNQNKRSKEILDSIDKYDFDALISSYFIFYN